MSAVPPPSPALSAADKRRLLAELTAGHDSLDTLDWNAVDAAVRGALPPLPETLFSEGALAYDMMYGAAPTVFLEWAQAFEVRCVDGLGMLVGQAAESWYQWRGTRPDTTPVLEALRADLR